MSEYNILNTLQQMTMAANTYNTQTGTPDKAIAELLIAGFSGQLKGWWDYHLIETDHLHILNSIQTYEDQTPILDPSGNTIQDAVSTLILTISLHFVGDPSHLKDKNVELLSNLRCKKLSDFQWYKNTFLTRIILREDSNQPFWKEKFLAGLPILLGEKVRNKIKETFTTKTISYDQLTYGELVSFTQKEDKDTINQIQNLYIEATDTDHSPSDTSEEEFQIDEIATTSATSNASTNSKQINVLTQDQEFILEAIKSLDDPHLQKTYLDKLLKDFNQPEHPSSNPPSRSILPSTSTNTYDLTKILRKKKSKTTVTIPELQSEIKTLKSKLKTLKQAQQKDSAILQHLLSKIESQSDIESESEDQTIGSHALPHTLTNIEHIPDDFLNQLQNSDLQKKIIDLQNKIEQQICSDLPNAFWTRKQHIIDLPYEDLFQRNLYLQKQDLYK
uniref:DUF7746 domain-containing protein n=1 Tax=Populus trichocarpa TaxID=3694 RepID=A0A2K2AGZ1_POPTR